MAPESLIYKVYSAKSDVWSFACTILEVLDGGRDPFPDLDPVQAASSVMHKNVRPQIPDNCPPKLEFLLSGKKELWDGINSVRMLPAKRRSET